MSRNRYSSPLTERYASATMLQLWSPRTRHILWRRIWLALAEAQKSLGIDIPDEAIRQMRDHLEDIDFEKVAEYEAKTRHDVMAHIHAFGDAAPAARGIIHLGATSALVTDNGDLIQMRRGIELLRGRVIAVLSSLAAFARKWRDVPTLGYTHLQPAQLTTVGKRATLWMQDLVIDLDEIDHRLQRLPLRGVKGTTGTQASLLDLLKGDHAKVRELDRLVAEKMGVPSTLPVTGQTYTRKLDAHVLAVLSGIAASAAKFAGDVRLLQSYGEIEEPFEKDQVGSSAMAYKRNPMRAERINSLSRFVLNLESNANQTHSVQFFERTLDDSANRRLTIPESFLATDAILILMDNVANGLEVHEARIQSRIAEELPFMATEALLMRAVERGGDRQKVHEVIRRHAIDVAKAVKDRSARNDLLDRLAADPAFGVPMDDIRATVDPRRFFGRAPEQVDEFLREVVDPILSAPRQADPAREEVRV